MDDKSWEYAYSNRKPPFIKKKKEFRVGIEISFSEQHQITPFATFSGKQNAKTLYKALNGRYEAVNSAPEYETLCTAFQTSLSKMNLP